MADSLGRILPPYGGRETCQNSDCPDPTLSEERGAFLHRNLDNDKLLVFCGPCSQLAELVASTQFPLVAL